MKKNELMNGDIVVLRSGHVAVVIKNDSSYLMFQTGGWDDLEDYDDDMNYLYPDKYYGEDAIMQVYRTDYGYGFSDFEDYDTIYERDNTWIRPTVEEMKQTAAAIAQMRKEDEEKAKETFAKKQKNTFGVIIQAFYGNRTYTEVTEDTVDRIVLGYLDSKLTVHEEIDRTIVKIPNSDCVLVYNKYQEAERLEDTKKWFEEDGYVAKPLASIPELNLNIYSRCFMCRLNDNGSFESIKDEDTELIEKILAV